MAAGKTKALAKWDAELAKEAEVAAAMEANTGGGQFISTRGGKLSIDDAPVPGNRMAVHVLDHIMENVYYEGDYDADNPSAPSCYAFGRDEKTMSPHPKVVEAGTAVSEKCAGCPNNEFGSADKGRGKACKNTRRLALLPAGTYDEKGKLKLFTDSEHHESANIRFMKLPVTSVKGFAGFVKSVAGTLKMPPHGIITKVSVEPDAKTQHKVVFEPVQKLPESVGPAVMKRREEAKATIEFPYASFEESDDKPKGKKGGKKAARKY